MAARRENSFLNTTLWGAQIFLAVSFLVAGLMKLALPFDQVVDHLRWAQGQPEALIRFIGVCELAAVVGLLMPGWTRSLTLLTPVTAFALMGLMFLAMGFHLMKHQVNQIGVPLALFALSTFVAFGRLVMLPLEAHPPPRPMTR